MKRPVLFLALALGLALAVNTVWAQSVYFVDGYHGGIYGHYPLWNTQFYVDKLTQHPEWQICIEIEPETWDVAKEKTPEAYRAFQQIAACPRVEFVNPTLAQPYMYNVSGESIIRQFRYGMELIHAHFPDVTFTTYSVEEPCFTSCLPQILKSFGLKYAVLKCPNTCWGGYSAAYGGELVNWVGPDGTQILTVPRYACEELNKKEVWNTMAHNNSDEYLAACFAAGIKHPVGMCFQDAGWKNGPWLGTGNTIKNNSIYQTWRNYIENVTDGKTNDNYYFTQEDVLPALMWGSQVLQKLARQVRTSENNMIVAEKMNAMHYLLGGVPANDSLFRNAWRTLALSQHHDSWIVPYNELTPGKTWAQSVTEWTANTNRLAGEIIGRSLPGSSEGLPDRIRIINTTSTAREEFVEVILPLEYSRKNILLIDESGKQQPVYKTVKEGKTALQFIAVTPAFGYSCYQIKTATNPKAEAVNKLKANCDAYYAKGHTDKFIIENDLYKITFDLSKGGTVSSLIAKKIGGKEFVDRASAFAFGELRGFFYEEEKYRSNTEYRAEISVVEKTPGKVKVKITNHIAGHAYSQFMTLCRGQERIDCSLQIDWNGNPGMGEFKAEDTWRANHRPSYDDRYKLLLLLPVAVGEQQVYKNAPFDVCKSLLHNTFYSTWDNIKHNVVLNWVDFAGKDEKHGLALFTDHTTTYTHGADFPPGLTIQYAGKGLWGKDYPITESTEIQYALLPHAGLWDKAGLWTKSVAWNEPLLIQTYAGGQNESGTSLFTPDKKGYEITTTEVKDDELYIRFFNAESDEKPLKISLGFLPKKIEEVRLNGVVDRPVEIKEVNGTYTIEIAMPRFGLKTLKVSLN